MQLQADGPGVDLLVQRRRERCVALAQKTQVHREGVGCLQHALDVPRARRAGGGKGAGGRSGAAAQHGGDARSQRLFHELRADEVDVRVDAAGRDDVALATDDFGAGADDDVHTRLGVGVTRFANGCDAPVFQADVGLDDAPVVQDQGVGHDGVHGAFGARALRLRHAVAYGLATTELDFFAVAAGAQRVVGLDFNDQVGIGQAHPVAHCGAKHFGVSASSNRCHYKAPCVKPRNPNTLRSPA